MPTAYIKCTLTDMDLSEESYPSPPNILYLEYPIPEDGVDANTIGTVVFNTFLFTFSAYDWLSGSPIRIRYVSYEFSGIYWEYAELHSNLNSDFHDAKERGILSGSYVGEHGETWNIEHKLHADVIDLPSGEGGEVGTVFTFSPPVNESPNKAQNPTPANDASDIKLVTAQISWEAG